MKLYWYPRTRASRAVWMLEEAGLEYERVHLNLTDPDYSPSPEFLAASPMGKVPALEDGPARLADSAAICLYIADRYAPGALAPATDHPDRGRFLYWMFFAPGAMEPAMAEKIGGWQPNRRAHGWGDFDTMIHTLETGLATGPWLMGDTFTAADVMVGSTAAFMKMFDLMPGSDSIEAYLERCLARPAYVKAREIDAAA